MNGTDYAFAVARVRSNESRLLTSQDIENLLNQPSASATLERLASKGWGDSSRSNSPDIDIIETERTRLWAFIDEIAPDPTLFDALRLPNDFHNLKASIKAVISNTSCEKLFMRPSVYKPDELYTTVLDGELDSLPQCMRSCAVNAYRAQLEQADGQLCDIFIDRTSLETALSSACARGGLIEKIVKLRTFAANIKTAYRCAVQEKSLDFMKSAFADGSSPSVKELSSAALDGTDSIIELVSGVDSKAGEPLAQSLAAFEKYIDERELALAYDVRYENLSPDVLTAYIINREAEIRNVRIILTAQRNDIPSERVRTMLRVRS